MTLDVLTLGEAMARLSTPPGVPLHRAATLDVHVAGAEANVAVALASLDRSVAWVSRLPQSDLGRRVARDLVAAGVRLELVDWDPSGRLGIYFVDAVPGGVSIIYDRRHSAFAAMSIDDFPRAEVERTRLVHLTGITPALSDSCRVLAEAVAAEVRDASALLSIDVNYRAKLWSGLEARHSLEQLASGTDLLLCTREDARDVFGVVGEPAEVASVLADRLGAVHSVVTSGADGAYWWHSGELEAVPALPTPIIDRLGAGDAFAAGVIDGLLDGDVAAGLGRGMALAAVALTTNGDQVTVTRSALQAMLEPGGRTLDR